MYCGLKINNTGDTPGIGALISQRRTVNNKRDL
jgi:hypothetical protein